MNQYIQIITQFISVQSDGRPKDTSTFVFYIYKSFKIMYLNRGVIEVMTKQLSMKHKIKATMV